jgi:glutaminyl-tRNA synthetase
LATAPENTIDFAASKAKTIIKAYLEPSLKDVKVEERFQFERHGYFVADRRDSQPGEPVFNRTVTLRDSWSQTK